jgi:hypothetical protein
MPKAEKESSLEKEQASICQSSAKKRRCIRNKEQIATTKEDDAEPSSSKICTGLSLSFLVQDRNKMLKHWQGDSNIVLEIPYMPKRQRSPIHLNIQLTTASIVVLSTTINPTRLLSSLATVFRMLLLMQCATSLLQRDIHLFHQNVLARAVSMVVPVLTVSAV